MQKNQIFKQAVGRTSFLDVVKKCVRRSKTNALQVLKKAMECSQTVNEHVIYNWQDCSCSKNSRPISIGLLVSAMRKTRLIDIDNVVKKLIDSDTKVSHDTCRRYKYLDTAHLWLLRITVRPPLLTPFKFLGTPLAPATKIIYQEKINIFR